MYSRLPLVIPGGVSRDRCTRKRRSLMMIGRTNPVPILDNCWCEPECGIIQLEV